MASRQSLLVIAGNMLGALSLWCGAAQADDRPRPGASEASGFHGDAEIDPLAYAFAGYSVHVGVGYRRLRFDLGAFALDTPSFLESNEGFKNARNGYGMKLQYYPFEEQSGGFVGVQAELVNELIESERSDAAHRARQLNLGLNFGWRFMLGNFYVTPWLLLNYTVGARDVRLDGMTYEASALFPFLTVHVGYRFL